MHTLVGKSANPSHQRRLLLVVFCSSQRGGSISVSGSSALVVEISSVLFLNSASGGAGGAISVTGGAPSANVTLTGTAFVNATSGVRIRTTDFFLILRRIPAGHRTASTDC